MPGDIQFDFWRLDRVVVHEIFLRDQEYVPPSYGTALFNLGRDTKETFLKRIQSAVSNDSKCMGMRIVENNEGSFLAYARALLDTTTDEEFLASAKSFADLLVRAQTSRAIPGGILIIFTGTVSPTAHRFVGAVKAESQDGFVRQMSEQGPTLQLIRELFLTPSAKMYKLGIFIEKSRTPNPDDPVEDNFFAFVYDYLMTKVNRDVAAIYFYRGFLGCDFPKDAARETKIFFDLTKKFIFSHPDLTDEEKYEHFADLQSYLRSTESTVHTSTFADRYIAQDEDRDSYVNYMRDSGFPSTAVRKDIRDIENRLKNRKVKFGSSIRLSGPADKMDQLVSIEKISGPEDDEGFAPEWSKIIIKDRLRGTE